MPRHLKHGPVFGVFADPHYSLMTVSGGRHFARSPYKLRQCMRIFSERKVELIVCLGDLIDARDDRAIQLLGEAADTIESVGVNWYLAPGNHDVTALTRYELLKVCRAPCLDSYYSFDHKGVHFIILDSNFSPGGIPYTHANMAWDNCYVGREQLNWLAKDLEATAYPALVFVHANLDVRIERGILDPHVVRDHNEVRSVLEQSGKVKMVFQGHYHPGHHARINHIPYYTLRAMVEGESQNSALLVSVENENRIHIEELFDK